MTKNNQEKKFRHEDFLKYAEKIDEATLIPLEPKPIKPPKPTEPKLYPFPTETACPPGEHWSPPGFIEVLNGQILAGCEPS